MLKAEELRIGNWAQLKPDYTGKKVVIKDINDQGINFYNGIIQDIEYSQLEGITLTPEILAKAGCSKYDLGYYNLTDDTIISIDNHVYFVINDNSKHWLAECNYIHQLQNLYFALTGEELTIEL